jgi:hypothetical protein
MTKQIEREAQGSEDATSHGSEAGTNPLDVLSDMALSEVEETGEQSEGAGAEGGAAEPEAGAAGEQGEDGAGETEGAGETGADGERVTFTPEQQKVFEARLGKEVAKRKAEQEKAEANQKQEKIAHKVTAAEAFAKENIKDLSAGKYSNIDDVIALAQELTATKPRYAKQINDAFADDSMTEAEVVEVIFDIARLNPKWGTTAKAENNGDVEKMVKNANKQQTSAALSGGKGSRVVTMDDLTPEDAAKLTQNQWNKLPREVKDRILRTAA